ncbi:unnamed protein product [Chondrus crispus]|uniref:Uncharacterized protein n=1 Tax=Chondrus crispus TaxID=2769 RepID=R7QPV9_CHOCR|nr:unnamed protein product [Chondrus crispus]CDF40512.1 unnamed protein product [Chondrus crispus]|eukprot:XP_005710806.1 unnamed protein product [Chondrus crispus]
MSSLSPRVPLLLFCVLLLLSTLARANYGHENKELSPDAKQVPLREDDAAVRADDEAFHKVETEKEALTRKLNEIQSLQTRMFSKAELLKRVTALKSRISVKVREEGRVKEEETKAVESLRLAEQKKNATFDEKEHIAEERRNIEKLLVDLKAEGENFDTAFSKMDADRKKADARERELEMERERLMKKVEGLVTKFQDSGFHTWLERNVDILHPIIKETILKTTNAFEPVWRGVDEAAELNEQLTNETTEAINQYLPAIKNSPFYSGLIFYVILLCPTVVAAWLVMKVRQRLSLMTVEHYLIAINLYFGLLSVVCVVMTVLSRTDILIVFRHRSQHMAESFMILHGFLFVCHLVLHGMTAYVSGALKDFAQYICMSCVGLHFFMNAYKRTILNQDPHIGAPAYVIYSVIFLYTLYDRGSYIIEAAVKDRKADTSAFATYPDQSYTHQNPSSSKEGRDNPVYFAGLPIFSSSTQSAMNDAKTI